MNAVTDQSPAHKVLRRQGAPSLLLTPPPLTEEGHFLMDSPNSMDLDYAVAFNSNLVQAVRVVFANWAWLRMSAHSNEPKSAPTSIVAAPPQLIADVIQVLADITVPQLHPRTCRRAAVLTLFLSRYRHHVEQTHV